MDTYIAELDDRHQIAAIWVKKKTARGPRVFDPKKHIFDPQSPSEFIGAAETDIVNWLASATTRE